MKRKLTTLLCLSLGIAFSTHAQEVKEKDILGTWKMVIDIDEELDQEAEEADTYLEEIIIKSVSGLVDGIMGNIDIYFDFQRNNDLLITVKAFGEVEEDEARWFINHRGYLEIEDVDDDDDDDGFNISSDDDEWKLIDGLLISDDHEDDRNVYMTRVD